MFSVRQKREIADQVQKILRDTNHPELPEGEIVFTLSVKGKEVWSWANIANNGAVLEPSVNPHNERMDTKQVTKEEDNDDDDLGWEDEEEEEDDDDFEWGEEEEEEDDDDDDNDGRYDGDYDDEEI